MCLAIPLQIIELLDNDLAIAGGEGNATRISLALLEESAAIGDFVLVHAGFAIARVEQDEARETLAMIREIDALSEDAAAAGGTD